MASQLGDIQNTLSSWDACMSKAYCKWPVIVAIIIGCLIVLSVVFCIARCLCFGAECCACCCSCFTCCCPSRQRGTRGYQQPPPPPPPAPYTQHYPQYNSPPAPFYGQPSPYRGPQTATFESPVKSTAAAKYNEDALPAMPSWDHATTRHVEEDPPVEMDRLSSPQQAQQQHLLAGQEQNQYGQGYAQSPQHSLQPAYSPGYNQGDHTYGNQPYAPSVSDYGSSTQYADRYRGQEHGYGGDVGNMSAAPYHNYNEHRQYAPSMSPVSSTAYAPSTTAPPSYRTREPSMISPVQNSYNPVPARRPVQGSWRDV